MPLLPTPGVTTDWGDDVNAAIRSLHVQGTHAERDALAEVETGTLFSCSTHGLIYRWTGSTWATWAAPVQQDTGIRNVDALANLAAGFSASSSPGLRLRRVGILVQLTTYFNVTGTTPDGASCMTIPAGFRPAGDIWMTGMDNDTAVVNITTSGTIPTYNVTDTNGQGFAFSQVFFTNDTWPATLPGVPA